MEKVWIREGRPKKVFEKNDIHYFYWPIELGFGSIKIREFKIPTFPLKMLDYEPIKVLRHLNKSQVLSRFHYRVLLYFNNPAEFDGRNVVDFSFGSHSPYVISKISDIGSNIQADRMDAREICALQFLIGLYIGIAKNKLRVEVDRVQDYQVERNEVPDDATFAPDKSAAVLWVGVYPVVGNTPAFLWRIICPQK